MTWRSIFQVSDGGLLSVGQVWTDPPRPETGFIETDERPDLSDVMWDEVTRNWIPRPPKVWLDRFDDDLLSLPKYAQFRQVYNGLPANDQTKIRNAIRQLLGEELLRSANQADEVGK